MHRPLQRVTIACSVLLLPFPVLAGSPDATSRSRPGQASEAPNRARELAHRAALAAQAGDCRTAVALGPEIRDLDRAYYDQAFASDPAITGCMRSTLPAPSPASGRDGVMFGAGLSLHPGYSLVLGDLRAGWMVRPQLALFATLLHVTALEDDGGITMPGLGLRSWADRVFFDARVHGVIDDGLLVSATAGIELAHRPHVGLEVHASVLAVGSEPAFAVDMGVDVFP